MLAIRGGDTGAQPFRTRRGLLVFNGEIYNVTELVKELVAYGVEVDGSSDTAVVAGLLDVHGIKGVDKLNGMYALAWDDGEELWLARDPVGIKPLYYVSGRDRAFASELAPLLQQEWGGARLHAPAMARWLTFHVAYGTETFFAGVQRVPAGGIVALREGRVVRSADTSLTYGTPNRAIDAGRLRKILERAVADAVPDEPFGIALSGGLDSSILAALASGGSREVVAYHGRVRAEGCDESRFAHDVVEASEGGLGYVEVEVTAEACRDAFERVVERLEEPVAGPGSLAQYVVAERASKDVRILLSGCGGDELFSGYARNAALALDAPPAGMEGYAPLWERLAGLDSAERAFAGLDRRAPQLFCADFLDAHPAPRAEFLEAFETGGLDPLAAAARAEVRRSRRLVDAG